MAQTVIFPEQTVEGFAFSAGDGAYATAIEAPFSLTAGETYLIVWDGQEYTYTAIDIVGAVAVGSETYDPCAIAFNPAAISGLPYDLVAILTASDAPSHTIAIYQGAAEQSGIILRDYRGEETVEYGVEGILLDTPDGGTKLYVSEDMIPEGVETTVELDFSGGDMVIAPGTGKAFSSVTIPVPENLAPENIPKDMEIAGIIGTLVGSGGDVKIANGTVTGNGSTVTVNHNMGVPPDVVIAWSNAPKTAYTAYFMTGFSAKVKQSLKTITSVYTTYSSSTQHVQSTASDTMSERTASGKYIHDPQENTFKIGPGDILGTDCYFGSGDISWLAIGGL